MRKYLHFEWLMLKTAWAWTVHYLAFKWKSVPIYVLGLLFGLLVLYLLAGRDIVSQELLISAALLAGVVMLFLGVLILQIFYAPYRIVRAADATGMKLMQENRQLKARIEQLQKPRFAIDVPHFKLGEMAGKLVCTTIVRASNCGLIPSTLDDWQAKMILADGNVIEFPTIWNKKTSMWGRGQYAGDGPPKWEITGDQFIYERVANTPIQPGFKVSGYLVGMADFDGGRPEPEFLKVRHS